MTHPSTSTSSPSHTILPERRCKWHVWRSKMKSVSNLSNFVIRSLIKLAFSSVSLLLWSLSSFKSSRRNSINTSFPVDMTFRTEFSFASFPFLFVAIHKPPICSFFFDIQKFGHIFYFLQRRSLTYIVVIGFQQCLIHRTQRCSLRLFSGNAMNISEMVVKKHFPVVHASTDFTQERRGVSLCRSIFEWVLSHDATPKYLNLTTSTRLCHAARSRTMLSRPSFGYSAQTI